jgi:hypothetical protein
MVRLSARLPDETVEKQGDRRERGDVPQRQKVDRGGQEDEIDEDKQMDASRNPSSR